MADVCLVIVKCVTDCVYRCVYRGAGTKNWMVIIIII